MKKGPGVQSVYRKYYQHARNAARRGIPFLLTFDEWLILWLESGHWHERGLRRGTYCMARPGDKGAYEIGNVKICLNEENRAERNRNYPLPPEKSGFFGKNPWAERTPEQQAQFSAAQSERMKGRKNPAHGKNYWANLSDDERAQRARKISISTANRRRLNPGRYLV